MTPDVSSLRLADADGFYEALLKAHEGLNDEDSALLNAQLVLLLANQVGDATVLQACLDAAREALRRPEGGYFASVQPPFLICTITRRAVEAM